VDLGLHGWSELVATNAQVVDEPVEAVFRMNENPILHARIYIFSPPLFYPKIFPILPTTYQPLPPTHSIARAPETSSGSELGARELGVGAWSRGAAGAGAGAMRDPGKHLTFFFSRLFCLFVCGAALHKIRSTVMQLHKQRLFLWSCVALQHNGAKEGDCSNAAVAFFFFFLWSYAGLELRCSAAPRRRR